MDRAHLTKAGSGDQTMMTRVAGFCYRCRRLAEGFGEGFNGPLVLAAEFDSPDDLKALEGLARTLSRVEGIAAVTPPMPSRDRTAAVMQVVPDSGPESQATEDLIHRLRPDRSSRSCR